MSRASDSLSKGGKPSVVTLTTDFGEGSPYVAQMKGVILTLNRAATIVDITHAIPPQNIRQGALVLDEVTRHFPPDTIHVAVVDPGVGTARPLVFARINDQQYIAPDNGLLGQLCRREPPREIIVLSNREYWLDDVSSTFHGRDILAPVAAYVSMGLDPVRLGTPGMELASLDWPAVRVEPRRIEGAIVSFDSFGNLITDISSQMLESAPSLKRVLIRCQGHEIKGIVRTYAQRPAGTLTALIGSAGLLELSLVNGDAARTLGLKVGDEVKLTW